MSYVINRSMTLNMLQILFSTLKIVVSVFLLMFSQKRCSVPLDMWIMLMMTNDAMYICSIIVSIYYATRIEEREQNPPQADERGNNHSPQSHQIRVSIGGDYRSAQNIQQREMRDYDRLENFEEDNKFYFWFNEFVKIYYIGIFLWGHVLLFLIDNDCKDEAPGLQLLMLIFLIFGYFYLFYPVLVVVAICLCLPVLIIAAYYFGGRGQQPAENAKIENLQKLKFHKQDFQEGSCVICQTEFEEEEEIIKLPCPNAEHVFHIECVTRWLKINGICPICRNKI